jgi:WD40 repeat protein
MRARVLPGAVWVLLIFAGTSAAEPLTPEAFLLKGGGVHVNRLAFSADGSRLAAAMSGYINQNGKDVTVPGKAIVWDVPGQRQVCVCNQANANFTHIWMSADGKVIVTADHGETNLNTVYHEWMAQIVTGNYGYQAWNAATGGALAPVMAPRDKSTYSAAALSADGHYLAAVFNENTTILISPQTPRNVGEIRVWDLAEKRIKWRLPGQTHSGPINWSDALAFSPNGDRLAVYRSMGDALSAAPIAPPPGRGGQTFKSTRVLVLNPGNATPTEKLVDKRGIALPARLEWPGDGTTLICRAERSFDIFDAVSGASKEVFKIPFPAALSSRVGSASLAQRSAPKAATGGPGMPVRPSASRLANPGGDGLDIPLGFNESQSDLSADGSVLVEHIQFGREAANVRENRVAAWDVRTRRLLGLIHLADEPFTKRDAMHRAYNGLKGSDLPSALAVSGDGRWIAASDVQGNIHVYETAKLGGGDAAPAAPANLPARWAPIATSYDQALEQARGRLLAGFDKAITDLEHSGEKAAALETLRKEKQRFAEHGLVPWSEPMWAGVGEYLNALAEARNAAHAAAGQDAMPDSLRDRIDKQVLAHWKHQPGNRRLAFYSSGHFGDVNRDNSWTFENGRLILHWPNGFVSTCAIAADGLSYSGTNQQNRPVSGVYLADAARP